MQSEILVPVNAFFDAKLAAAAKAQKKNPVPTVPTGLVSVPGGPLIGPATGPPPPKPTRRRQNP